MEEDDLPKGSRAVSSGRRRCERSSCDTTGSPHRGSAERRAGDSGAKAGDGRRTERRWLHRSEEQRYVRETTENGASGAVSRPPRVGVVLAAVLLAAALTTGVIGASQGPDDEAPRLAGGFLPGDDAEELNRTRLEYAVHLEVNRVREERGLSPLAYDADLREIARYHSGDMAEADYFAHDTPDGETLEERYERFGYDCRAPIDERRYATSGENIAVTWYGVRVRSYDGTVYYDSVEAVAEGVVRNWMHSPGHRENLLREFWRREGVGVHVAERDGKTAVYATQNFC